MAEFEAKVYRLKIEEHPNADALEIARVGDYRSIVRKGQFKSGDLGVYIPEQAVCPLWLIQRLGLEGRLAGKAKNRVKAVKLRGVLSQGLIYPVFPETDEMNSYIEVVHGMKVGVEEGYDVTEELGIVKYEPVVPASMSGEVHGASGYTIKYDIENLKKYPDVLFENEPVVITEKLHGTWCCFGYHPDFGEVITSKGLSARGLVFKNSPTNELQNLYVRTLEETVMDGKNLIDRARETLDTLWDGNLGNKPFYILGEIYGRGVQDLHYGLMHPQFRAFDIFVGDPSTGRFVGALHKYDVFEAIGVDHVPVLYRGAFDKSVVEELTSGVEEASGTGANIREGIVITPMVEREDEELGRVILKSVSEEYLLRKGGTEFN